MAATGDEATPTRPGGEAFSGIVVGYDGSRNAFAALRWAVEDARRRRLPLQVVRAWTLTSALAAVPHQYGTIPSLDALAAEITDATERDLSTLDATGVEVSLRVVHGATSSTLVDAAESATLLVVGIRGGGGFTALRMGSTAEQVVRHAACTVVVARDRAG